MTLYAPTQTFTTKPRWTIADREIDVTDNWYEATADDESICTAFLTHDPDADTMRLDGIGITDEFRTVYWPRDYIMEKFGPAWVWRIEEYETEMLPDNGLDADHERIERAMLRI